MLKKVWTNGLMLSTCPQVIIIAFFIKILLTGYTHHKFIEQNLYINRIEYVELFH